jgi:hypothetical protein
MVPSFLPISIKFSRMYVLPTVLLSDHEFPGSRYSKKPYYLHGRKSMYVRTYDVYLSICLKFGVRYLHIMLLRIAEFGENR